MGKVNEAKKATEIKKVKKSVELRAQLDQLEKTGDDYKAIIELKSAISKERNREIEVGQGVSIIFYTDSHAGTIVRRTNTTLIVQRDIATLDKDFKPDMEQGGFSAHCKNQTDQKYTYERDNDGVTYKFYWSERRGAWQSGRGSIRLEVGRREFYDYNF